MKNVFSKTAIMAVFLCLFGCATVSDYINENPLVASIATRQAVARYIDAGDTPAM